MLILGSASRKAIKRVALENDEDRSFDTAFGFGSSSSGSSSSGSADPDAWLQWLAGLGVLWISSDSSDAGFSSSGLWFDTLSMIVKQVFMTKPKKGIVVVLWGSEVKHFKKEVCLFSFSFSFFYLFFSFVQKTEMVYLKFIFQCRHKHITKQQWEQFTTEWWKVQLHSTISSTPVTWSRRSILLVLNLV